MLWRILLLILPPILLSGCNDATSPGPEGETGFQGPIDPAAGTYVLRTLQVPVEGEAPIRLDLVGSGLELLQDGSGIAIRVAVHNADTRPLTSPAIVSVENFHPATVFPRNPDFQGGEGGAYGYDYSALLGPDGVLSPEETSESKNWIFADPGLVPFSFQASGSFGRVKEGPRIAGVSFMDPNENGIFDEDEFVFGGGQVRVNGPGMDGEPIFVPENGRFEVFVDEAGLYKLDYTPPPTFREVHVTTPNPLHVVLSPGPGGEPESFLDARFGVANGPDPGGLPQVRFAGSGQDFPRDRYALLSAFFEGRVLTLRVGFSGCEPDHPLFLYMVGGFMESNPVQARLLLSHDSRGEECDAYFERNVFFDLTPVVEEYERGYGASGTVILVFEDWMGETRRFEMRF